MTDQDPYYTATDIARLLHIPQGTVHRWAHEDHWARKPLGNRAYYRWAEACASYHNRRRRQRDQRASRRAHT